jgi:hypothetical protein
VDGDVAGGRGEFDHVETTRERGGENTCFERTDMLGDETEVVASRSRANDIDHNLHQPQGPCTPPSMPLPSPEPRRSEPPIFTPASLPSLLI